MPLRKDGNCSGSPDQHRDERLPSPVEDFNSQHESSAELQGHQGQHLQPEYPIQLRGSSNASAKSNKENRSFAEREKIALAARPSEPLYEFSDIDSEKPKSEDDVDVLQRKLEKIQQEQARSVTQIATSTREKINLQAQISKLEADKKSAVERLERKRAADSKNFNKEYAKLEGQYKKLEDENATLNDTITALSTEQRNLSAKLHRLQQERKTWDVKLNTCQNEQEAEKNFFQKKWAELISDRSHWVNTNKSLSQAVGMLQQEKAQIGEAKAEVEEENSRLIEQCSGLVKEVSELRVRHLVDDDSALRDKFHSLHFAIRSWCCAIHDAKVPEYSAVFSNFPLGVPGSDRKLCYLYDEGLNVLIACMWEWMVKLVFGSTNAETGYNDSPDLWTDEDAAVWLHNLESRLQNHDPKAAVEWRSLTVRHLAAEGLGLQESRVEKVAREVLQWTRDCFQLDVFAESMFHIRQNLKTEVVAKAIDFSLCLRRQYSIVSPHIPQNLDQLIAIHLRWRSKEISRGNVELKFCVRPQLRRLALASKRGQLSHDNIVEVELGVLKNLHRLPPEEIPLPTDQDEVD